MAKQYRQSMKCISRVTVDHKITIEFERPLSSAINITHARLQG